jgi:hypothetical protein
MYIQDRFREEGIETGAAHDVAPDIEAIDVPRDA